MWKLALARQEARHRRAAVLSRHEKQFRARQVALRSPLGRTTANPMPLISEPGGVCVGTDSSRPPVPAAPDLSGSGPTKAPSWYVVLTRAGIDARGSRSSLHLEMPVNGRSKARARAFKQSLDRTKFMWRLALARQEARRRRAAVLSRHKKQSRARLVALRSPSGKTTANPMPLIFGPGGVCVGTDSSRPLVPAAPDLSGSGPTKAPSWYVVLTRAGIDARGSRPSLHLVMPVSGSAYNHLEGPHQAPLVPGGPAVPDTQRNSKTKGGASSSSRAPPRQRASANLPSPSTADEIQVFVVTPGGKTITVALSASETGTDLEQKVQKLTGIPGLAQRLVTGSKQLIGHHTLREQGVKEASTITLLLRLKGGARPLPAGPPRMGNFGIPVLPHQGTGISNDNVLKLGRDWQQACGQTRASDLLGPLRNMVAGSRARSVVVATISTRGRLATELRAADGIWALRQGHRANGKQ
jgi:hypothetical protein